MDFSFTPAQQALRADVREFLRLNKPSGWQPRGFIMISEEEWHVARQFDRKLGERGWLTPKWPKSYGGLEMDVLGDMVLNEELALAGAPDGGGMGHGPHYIGPAILEFGTEEQKARYLPPIVKGDEIWAQCFSEDAAGSDMANVQTTAVRQGDDYILNGTKIWTGQGHRAEFAIVTARTGDGPKHRSLSLFIVDLHSPGVTIQPIWTMPRHGRLNREIFDDVRVPARNLIGRENEAWPIMLAVMAHERGSIVAPSLARRILSSLLRAANDAPEGAPPRSTRPQWRLEAVDLSIEIDIARDTVYRVNWLSSLNRSSDVAASVVKMVNGRIQQRLAQLLVRAYGMHGLIAAPNGPTGDQGDWFTDFYLQSVQATIVSGSTEIMKNTIATRGLGLPRS